MRTESDSSLSQFVTWSIRYIDEIESLAGKKLFIDKIRQNPFFRALRVDKLTLSVLDYVLRAYLRGDTNAIPTLRMLQADEAELRGRAEAFAVRAGHGATAAELKSIVGGGSAPEVFLPSWGVRLRFAGLTDVELERRLRSADPPVIVRVEDGDVLVDFRTIFPGEEGELLRILEGCRRGL